MGGDVDPLGCAQIRRRVLGIWAADPARLVEDANHELDLVRGGYAGRVVVELAANAADAALRSGGDGRLLLRLERDGDGRGVLLAANTGAALDEPGLAGLVSLRASAKARDSAPDGSGGSDGSGDSAGRLETGRFGVGFAAVLGVCDTPVIASRAGPADIAIGFSAERTARALEPLLTGNPRLADEVARRHGQLPVLRLPFPDEAAGAVPAGYHTLVRLVLRDETALAEIRRQLGELDDLLLLGLPGLTEVSIEDATVADPVRRQLSDPHEGWIVLSRSGFHRDEDLAGQPVEERLRRSWRVTWAIPLRSRQALEQGRQPASTVVHAPTPTQERLEWPASLVADLPLDSTRRQVMPGRATERLLDEAAQAYAELLSQLAADPETSDQRLLGLLPTGTVGGWLDADLRQRLWKILPQKRFLRPVAGGAERDPLLRPVEAIAVSGQFGDDPAALAALSPAVAGLVRVPGTKIEVLRRVGVHVLELAEIVEQWSPASVEQWTTGCRALAALAGDPAGREAVARLPIPVIPAELHEAIHSGPGPVMWRGARGVLLPGPDVPESVRRVLARLGAKVAQTAATADGDVVGMLERLGAQHVSSEDLLRSSVLTDLVRGPRELDPDDLDLTAAVLDLLGRVDLERLTRGLDRLDLTWCAELLVPDADDDPCPAALLVLPGSAMDPLMSAHDLGRVHPDWASRWPARVWQALGVAATGPVVIRMSGVDLLDPPEILDDLDGFDRWADHAGQQVTTVAAVRDLDLVRDDAWPECLRLVPHDVFAAAATGFPGYATWWLRNHLDLDRSADRDAAHPALRRWLPPSPAWIRELPEPVRSQLAPPATPAELSADAWTLLLQTMVLARDQRPSLRELLDVWQALGPAAQTGTIAVPRVHRFWALTGRGELDIVTADEVCIADNAAWLQRGDLGPMLVPGAAYAVAVADLLDLDLASERAEGRVTSDGESTALPAALESIEGLPSRWFRHDRLLVDGVAVRWWADDDGGCHAADPDGLAAVLAARAGRWPQRFRLAALLTGADPQRILLDDASG